jgi:hypothetical protein
VSGACIPAEFAANISGGINQPRARRLPVLAGGSLEKIDPSLPGLATIRAVFGSENPARKIRALSCCPVVARAISMF